MKIKRVVSIIGIILLALGVISYLYSSMEVRNGNRHLPTIFGLTGVTIQSGSMEPIANIGDYVLLTLPKDGEIEKGDIITFVENRILVTHRVEEIVNKDGEEAFITKGDANNVEDSDLVYIENIVGVSVLVIPKLGQVFNFVSSRTGLIVIGVIILILFLLPEKKMTTEKV